MARDLYQNVTDRILARLEAGTMPWIRPYSSLGAQLPMNAITNRPYNGINVLLFWTAAERGYPTPRFVTFRQAKAAGGTVRKGEHGMPLYFFKQLIVKDKKTQEDKRIGLLREYTVFNVAQCDGLPERIVHGPAIVAKNPDQRNAEAEQFILATGADFRNGPGTPCYIPSRDYIRVPDFKHFHKALGYYCMAFHELSHWTGAKPRLDRDLTGRFGTAAYAAEELVAELSAAFLCAEFGYDNEQQNACYIASWIKLLKEDSKAIFTAASKAQQAANYLRDQALADDEDDNDESLISDGRLKGHLNYAGAVTGRWINPAA